jgi:hypothetical protein
MAGKYPNSTKHFKNHPKMVSFWQRIFWHFSSYSLGANSGKTLILLHFVEMPTGTCLALPSQNFSY